LAAWDDTRSAGVRCEHPHPATTTMAQAGSSRIETDMPRARARTRGWQDENEDDEHSYANVPFDGIQRFFQAISDLEVRSALPPLWRWPPASVCSHQMGADGGQPPSLERGH